MLGLETKVEEVREGLWEVEIECVTVIVMRRVWFL